jgi:3-mercaptopropionate dioxygenase
MATRASRRSVDSSTHTPAGLDEFVAVVSSVVGRHADWERTARLVARELERALPPREILTPEQRRSDVEEYRGDLLHAEPDGTSIVAVVWRPGQMTAIHDHVSWCVFGIIQVMEREALFALDEERSILVEAGTSTNRAGQVSGFAPPGDVHRVRNAGDTAAISIHGDGTEVSRIGSSVRRYYEHPVVAA